MAQIRTTLRGVAHVLGAPPAAVLTALDRAVCSLNRGALATVVLAEVPPAADGVPLRVRWSNAGHPPPLLVCASGVARLLEHEPDPLLGVAPDTPRHDHEVALGAGDTMVLFTDGLVERRGRSIDDGLRGVRETAAASRDRTLEELCDALLARFPDQGEDDVAVLAVRVRPGALTAATHRPP